MLFSISSALKSLRRSWKINLLIIMTLYLAFLFFFLVCCYIEDGLLGLSSFRLKGMEQSVIYHGQVPFSLDGRADVSRDDIESLLDRTSVESAAVIEAATYHNPASGQDHFFYLVDENFPGHYHVPIVAGRDFTREELLEGAPVCLINQQAYTNGGAGPGDTIRLGGLELTVVGVAKYVPNIGAQFVPYRAFSSYAGIPLQTQYYQVAARGGELSSIDWASLGLTGQPMTGRKYYEDGQRRLLGRSGMSLAAGLFILAYALLNLINIMVNKLDQQQKSLGIRVALGASGRQIYLQFFLECLALVLGAVALVFASDGVVGPVAARYFNHYFGPVSFCAMLAVSLVSALLISRRLFGRFRGMGVAEIIKKL